MKLTGVGPTPTVNRSNYGLNVLFFVEERDLAYSVMPSGTVSSGASVSGQKAVLNSCRAELFEAEVIDN